MKLMVLSGFHFDYGRSVVHAFESLGHEVRFLNFFLKNEGLEGILRYSLLGRLGYDAIKRDRADYIRAAKLNLNNFNADAILVVRGTGRDFYSEIIEDYISRVGKKPKTAIWLMDEVKNIHGGLTSMNIFDHWFAIEPSDISLFKKQWGINAHFLSPAFDSTYYRPIEKTALENQSFMDLSFVGTLAHITRKEILEHLAKRAMKTNMNFRIITNSTRFPSLKYGKYPCLRKFLQIEGCDHKRNNWIYNTCRVNLNIHADYAIDGVNSRFFEIMGSGGLEIVDSRKAQSLLGFEPDRDFLSYSNLEELDEKIKYVFDHPVEGAKIAQSGHEKSKHHDFHARANFIMEQAFNR